MPAFPRSFKESCHPERSISMHGVHRNTKSKDPYSMRAAIDLVGYFQHEQLTIPVLFTVLC